MPKPLKLVTTLREHRMVRGWSMAEMAVKANVSLGVVARLELAVDHDDVQSTTLSKLVQLADCLETTVGDLYPRVLELDPNG